MSDETTQLATSGDLPPMKSMQKFIESQSTQIEAVAHRDVDAQRLQKILGMAMLRNPAIAGCTKPSVLQAVLEAAQLNLDLSGQNNSAHIVIFRKKGVPEAKLMPGYGGLIDIACRSGTLTSFDLVAVYEEDKFSFQRGTDPQIRHYPDPNADRTKRAIYLYAVAWFRTGQCKWDVMSRGEIEAIRLAAPSKDSAAWTASGYSWNEMAKKTVVRRLCKSLPLNPDAVHAVGLMDEAESMYRPVRRRRGERTGPEKGMTEAQIRQAVEQRKAGEEVTQPSGGSAASDEFEVEIEEIKPDDAWDQDEINRMMKDEHGDR